MDNYTANYNITYNTICCVAGRSGGHIIPGVTYTSSLLKKYDNPNLLLITTNTQLDNKVVNSLDNAILDHVPFNLDNFPRKHILLYPKFIFQFIYTFFKSLYVFYKVKPHKIVSMGGYISIPVCGAAYLLNIPIELFELNVEPGRAVKTLKSLATTINICFSDAARYFVAYKDKIKNLTYPVQFSVDDKLSKKQACKKLNFDSTKFTILILGGSQGSRFINDLSKNLVENNTLDSHVQIIHQAGPENLESLKTLYGKHKIVAHVFDYLNNLALCYSAADIVIARAGAGTLFELAYFEKKSIIIPLEITTTQHQISNALSMKKMYPSLFTIIKQSELEKNNFTLVLNNYLSC